METYGDDDIYEVLDLDTLGASVQVVLPTEQDVGLDDTVSQEAVAANPPSNGRASAKTPKRSSSSSGSIVGIGRAGAVKPIELKTSTPSRSSSNASASGKSDSSPLNNVKPSEEKPSTSKAAARGTPQRNKAGVPPIPDKSAKTPSTTAPSPAPSAAGQQTPGRKVVSPPTPQKTPSPSTNGVSTAKDPSSASSSSSASSPAVPSFAASPLKNVGLPPQPPAASIGTAATPTPPPAASPLATSAVASAASPVPGVPEEPPLTEEQKQILRMIDESFHFLPDSRDSEKANHYVPRNLYPTPAAFPSAPAPLFEKPAVFEKLDVDTLFFIFYYQQGSYQQYLAARELKRRTWGYHKKYKTWFKRHEEPQVTGEDYEQGTFVYFDYETGWCQRIKTEFTFEYSYLEDELQ